MTLRGAFVAGDVEALFCAVVMFVVIALTTALAVERPIIQHNAFALRRVYAVFSALPANLAVGTDNNILVLERIPRRHCSCALPNILKSVCPSTFTLESHYREYF